MATTMQKLPNMEQQILAAIHRSIEAAVEQAIENAKNDLERVLREKLTGIALELAREVQVEYMRDHIVLTIKDQRKG